MKKFENIPEELRLLNQWVCHRNKIPYNPTTGYTAKALKPDTWSSYDEAVKAYSNRNYDGIGFEFNNNGIVGIDLDKVISEDGALSPEALEIVTLMDSYTEISPSGKGLHIFVKGNIPENGRRKGFIVIYKAGRYFTMTGNIYGNIKPINECPEQLKSLWNKYFSKPEFNINPNKNCKSLKFFSIGLEKDSVFKDLLEGNYESEKCKSESEKDLALMSKLLYWCSGDIESSISAFLDSPYANQKDDLHTKKLERSDYLTRTAISVLKDLTSTALIDNEIYIRKFTKGTDEIQKLLKELKPNTNYSWDDKGNGELFADIYIDTARFNVTANDWCVYDGKVWIRDTGSMVISRMAKQLKDELMMFSVSIENEKQKNEYQKHILKLGRRSVRDIMIKDSRDKNCISNTDLDNNPDLINLKNGTLNLKTFEFREHKAKDLLSKLANVDYDRNLKSELWVKFLDEVMEGNKEKIEFIQKAVGYGITADTSLETCFILYGATTRNGKSTFVETIMYMLGGSGGYSLQMKPESLAQKYNIDSRQASGDIARLAGARFLNVSEPPKKMIFDAALLKTLLGRDSIVARHLHEREFEFIPQFKLFMNTNYLPLIKDDTLFSSGRINVISFDRHFEEYEQDKDLKNKLKSPENLSGIFNWCIEGLKKYYEHGLILPDSIVEATNEYRKESDKVGKFITECLEPAKDNITARTLYYVYEDWCRACGYGCENQGNFYSELRAKNLLSKTGTVNGITQKRIIKGYKVLEEWNRAIPFI